MRADESPRYWFPAKRHGWGWGPPRTWQGWLVLLVYVAVVTLVGPLGLELPAAVLVVVLATVVLLVVCLRKGEPARWRWGGDQ